MKFSSLQTRFLVAGSFLVLITVVGGAWSLVAFAGLNAALGEKLRESQAAVDLTASLADLLEREDDALLLALSGKVRNARSDVAQQRREFDDSYTRLLARLSDPEQREAALALRKHTDAYRTLGDALLQKTGEPGARADQGAIDAAARLAEMLEREDDAILLALTGEVEKARSAAALQRQEFDQTYSQLVARLRGPDELAAGRALREHVDAYRAVGDALLHQTNLSRGRDLYNQKVNPALRKAVGDCARIRELGVRAMAQASEARDSYHENVNPALREAVADCARIRELNFQDMQQVGVQARNSTGRAAGLIAGGALIALGLATVVMVLLAQGIIRPVRELTRSMEAIRHDDFKTRVNVNSDDELGHLAAGFNRMAETLGDYRESSLGELLLAKSTLEATVAALPDAVIVVDPDGEIVSKNPLADDILRAIGGEKALRFAELPLPGPVLHEVQQVLDSGHGGSTRPELGQALSVSLDGRPLKMLVSVVPIREFLPHRAGAAIVIADVTEFARLDELRSEVVAVASHELKTPLTALQMNLLMLQEKAENLTAQQREMLAAAIRGGDELTGTIEELLDLARIEAGQLRLAQERVDLAALIDQVVSKMRPHYESAEVALRVVKEVAPALVLGDPARLRLVFVNLLTNALKYTPGGGEVVVRLASMQNAAASGKPKLQVTVTDTGVGIPAELRERVFEKFFRVEDQQPDGPKGVRGTGIGLYVCREIIEAHGGEIRCLAGDHRGTEIAIVLDAARPAGQH